MSSERTTVKRAVTCSVCRSTLARATYTPGAHRSDGNRISAPDGVAHTSTASKTTRPEASTTSTRARSARSDESASVTAPLAGFGRAASASPVEAGVGHASPLTTGCVVRHTPWSVAA